MSEPAPKDAETTPPASRRERRLRAAPAVPVGRGADTTSTAATRTARRGTLRSLVVLWTLALGVVVVDQLTKAWALRALADGHRVDLLGDWFGLVLVRNPGAAFSFATGQTWIFTVVAVVVSVVVIRVSRRLDSLWWAVVLGLVLGGAVGNLIDRLVRAPGVFRGHVIDFIDYGGFFVGNVADIAIVVAAVAIVGLSMIGLEVDGTRAGDDDEAGRAAADTVLGSSGGRDEAPTAAATSGACAAAEAGGTGRSAGTADQPGPSGVTTGAEQGAEG